MFLIKSLMISYVSVVIMIRIFKKKLELSFFIWFTTDGILHQVVSVKVLQVLV